VLLASLAGAILLWAPLAAVIAQEFPMALPVVGVFASGIVTGLTVTAALAVGCVVAAFHRFDVSLHVI